MAGQEEVSWEISHFPFVFPNKYVSHTSFTTYLND